MATVRRQSPYSDEDRRRVVATYAGAILREDVLPALAMQTALDLWRVTPE